MTNDNVLLITFGEPGDGLNNFTITGRDWITLDKWLTKFHLEDCYGMGEVRWYKVAEQMTPHQLRKFPTLLTKNEAQEFIIEFIGMEQYQQCIMERAEAMIKYEKCVMESIITARATENREREIV